MIPVLLAPEQVTVTSGADPMVDITLRNGALFFPELDDLARSRNDLWFFVGHHRRFCFNGEPKLERYSRTSRYQT